MSRVTPQQLFVWLDGHPGQLPKELKGATRDEDQRESRLARYLRHLRGQKEAGKLPPELGTKLNEVSLAPTIDLFAYP